MTSVMAERGRITLPGGSPRRDNRRMSTTTALSVAGVTKRFGPVTAVDDVSMTVGAGDIVALLGPNGAGKTTLLDMVLGFTSPDSGTIEVFGGSPGRAANRGMVGAMLQTGGLLKDLTVGETIRMVGACHASPLPFDDVVERAGVAGFLGRKVGSCSGGQAQRLRFGLALLPDPPLLLLDEPTAGMDAAARRDFWATMHAEAGRGRTIVFATHYLAEADDFADRLVLLRDGSVVVEGTIADLVRTGHRTVTGTWTGESSPFDAAREFGLPGDAVAVASESEARDLGAGARGARVSFTAPDGDALALHLLTRGLARDLEIRGASVEDLFFEVTGRADGARGTSLHTEIGA